MRVLLVLALVIVPVFAQNPVVQLINTSRPASTDFQVGDRFEIVITGSANQPISVRTTMQGRTDWGPVIAWTNLSGRWSMTGQFEKSDFGGWTEVWTVGGKLANSVQFFVGAPCLKGGQGFFSQSGKNMVMTCETAQGSQNFATPNDTDSFRTPGGRLVSGRMRPMTSEQYRADVMQYLITSHGRATGASEFGDQAGDLIAKTIGVNALSDEEMRSVLSIIHAAFAKPEGISKPERDPSRTLSLLQHLEDMAGQESLKQQIVETMAYVQTR